MPDYGDYCPVQMAAEVVADRWTPLIVRELVLGNTRFNDIARAMPGISRSLPVQRLRHLERKGVLETWPSPTGRGSEYHLTPAGKDLERVLDVLGRWAVEWLFEDLRPHDVPPTTLMWWMRRRVDPEAFPPTRTTLEFRHTAPVPQTIWLVLDRGDVSVCQQHPGFEVDLVATATTAEFADVFQGYRTWQEAVAGGRIEVAGPPRLAAAPPLVRLEPPGARSPASARTAPSARRRSLPRPTDYRRSA
ncbi:helix-turn-helix domain-containing protein [Nocardioides sp. TF02-7]|uniref:winged helix-turn-helix transcriptional regulator n=1 Tax=Nocardioides sp. TF02-7 TaxID=2917724 RepID=UPI001F06F5ED|nr:helix-turn-helix domain-containing protein [Nocardioides sp. TF02-7]UMG93003.1 helix-turn-helix transcriptional regulator [Nocardioides sp. TF02-7]